MGRGIAEARGEPVPIPNCPVASTRRFETRSLRPRGQTGTFGAVFAVPAVSLAICLAILSRQPNQDPPIRIVMVTVTVLLLLSYVNTIVAGSYFHQHFLVKLFTYTWVVLGSS